MLKKRKNKDIPEDYPRGFGIEWTSRRSFQLGGYNFDMPMSFEQYIGSKLDPAGDRFYISKTPGILKRYFTLFNERRPGRILELGVQYGGSAAFLQLVTDPAALLALELDSTRIEILDKFVEEQAVQDRLHVEYGVSQDDNERVRDLVIKHLGPDRCIDLVIDDASHMLEPTRHTFQTVFPRLKPGASYIVEDHASAHIVSTSLLRRAEGGDEPAKKLLGPLLRDSLPADRKPLHVLAVEAMLASINNAGLIQRIIVDRQWLRIVRGHEDFEDINSFDLRALADDQFSLLETRPSDALAAYLN